MKRQDASTKALETEIFEYLNSPDTDKEALRRALNNCRMRKEAPIARKRGRPRKVEPFWDWMQKIEREVETEIQKLELKAPSFVGLTKPQQLIVDLLIEHMRALPKLAEGDSPFTDGLNYRPAYATINIILSHLFIRAYPAWRPRSDGSRNVCDLPEDGRENFKWLLKNCGGVPVRSTDDDD